MKNIELLNNSYLLDLHIKALINIEPRFKAVYTKTGLPKLRVNKGGFFQLYKTIISQQLSIASANSIWQRLLANGFDSEAKILSSSDNQLRQQGLSRQKIRYIKSLAEHNIDYESLYQLADEEVIEKLTAVTGIGRWTAEIYCLFVLKRSNILPADDLALKISTQQLLGLADRPKTSQLQSIAADWMPYRSAASYLLWEYYQII